MYNGLVPAVPCTDKVLTGPLVPMPTLPNVPAPLAGPTKNVGTVLLKPMAREFAVLLTNALELLTPLPRTKLLFPPGC